MQSVTATRPWASLLSAPAVPHPAPTHELTGVPLTTDRWDAPGQPLSGCQAANSLWVLLGSLSLLPPLVAVGKGRHLLQGRRLQRIAMHARVLRAMSRRGMAVVERGEVPAVPYVRTQWAQGGAATAASDAYEPSPAMGSAPQASPQATIGVMPPELAAITHATLFGRGGEVQLPAHALRRELGSGIFSALRADARGARAMLSAGASGLACKATLDVEVRAFLARSWWRLAAALTPEAGLRRLRRAASLLGLLLAAVPEAEAREGFGRVLAEWSAPQGAGLQRRVSRVRSCTELRAMLEDHTVALAFAEELSPEARHAHARNVLHILRTMPQDAELAVQAVTEAAAIVAEAMPEFLDESVEALRECLERFSISDIVADGAWDSMNDAPPRIRLAFLFELAQKGGSAAWEACGVDVVGVADTCADIEVAASKDAEHMNATLPHVKQALCGEDLELVEHLFYHLRSMCGDEADGVRGLAPAKGLVLVRSFGGSLGCAAPKVLSALVHDVRAAPNKYDDADILALADALPDTRESWYWAPLAQALVARWAGRDSGSLLQTMLGAPALLRAAPAALQRALAAQCEHDATALVSLTPAGLTQLIDAWAGSDRTLPAPLPHLLSRAVEVHLELLDARRLVAASRIISSDDRATAEADVMLCWQRWMEGVVESCRLLGWGHCHAALREVQRWRDADVAVTVPRPGVSSLADMVLQGVVVEQLCAVVSEVPVEFALQLGRAAAPGGAARAHLAPELERRVREGLRGRDGGLPLMAAIAVANGETLLECTPAAPFWGALTLSISSQLQSPEAIDLFCRCRPSLALRSAVLEDLGGWRALEVQMRLAC